MPEQFDDRELEILKIIQDQLPYSLTPFDDIAASAGVPVEDVLALISRLRENGVIRRFGASLRHQKSGWRCNAMVAWEATPEQAEKYSHIASAFPAISHVYYRPSPSTAWPYSFYTMMHGRTEEEIGEMVEKLLSRWPLRNYAILTTLRELKKTSMTYFRENDQDPSNEE